MEPAMATLTVKNIPENVYLRLKELAKLHHRSLNGEIINCLEHAVGLSFIEPAAVRDRAETFRQKFADLARGGEKIRK